MVSSASQEDADVIFLQTAARICYQAESLLSSDMLALRLGFARNWRIGGGFFVPLWMEEVEHRTRYVQKTKCAQTDVDDFVAAQSLQIPNHSRSFNRLTASA